MSDGHTLLFDFNQTNYSHAQYDRDTDALIESLEDDRLYNSSRDRDLRKSKRRKNIAKNTQSSYAKRFRSMGDFSKVHEFDRFVDMTDPRDVALYLEEYDSWLRRVRMPKTYEGVHDFVRAHFKNKKWRVRACSLLATRGNKRALLFTRFHAGTMNKEAFDSFDDSEAQSLELITFAFLASIFIAMIFGGYQLNEIRKRITPGITEAVGTVRDTCAAVKNLVENADAIVDTVGQALVDTANEAENQVTATGQKARRTLERITENGRNIAHSVATSANAIVRSADAIGAVVDQVREKANEVVDWFKNLYQRIVDTFKLDHPVVKWILHKMFLCFLIWLAFEFTKTMFPSFYSAIRSFVCASLGFVDPYDDTLAQAGGEVDDKHQDGNYLWSMLEGVRINLVKVSSKVFWSSIDVIPKITNCAKAIEWCLEHIKDLYEWIMEMWTGKIRGRNAMERSILEFSDKVDSYKQQVEQNENLFTESIEDLYKELDLSRREIENKIAGGKAQTLRPHFSHMLAMHVNTLVNTRASHSLKKKSSKERAVPVWCYIKGGPGVGKSSITYPLMAKIWDYLNTYAPQVLPKGAQFGYEHVFPMNEKEEFFDGYHGQFFTLIDDLFQQKSLEVRSATANWLITAISPTPFSLRVATVEQKAHSFFTSSCIISTTNLLTENFSAENLGLTDPSALETRRTVVVELKKGGRFVMSAVVKGEEIDVRPDYSQLLMRGSTTEMDIDELAALVGECIISRYEAVGQPAPKFEGRRFSGSYVGPRIAVDRSKGKSRIIDMDDNADRDIKEVLDDLRAQGKDLLPPPKTFLRLACVDETEYQTHPDEFENFDTPLKRRHLGGPATAMRNFHEVPLGSFKYRCPREGKEVETEFAVEDGTDWSFSSAELKSYGFDPGFLSHHDCKNFVTQRTLVEDRVVLEHLPEDVIWLCAGDYGSILPPIDRATIRYAIDLKESDSNMTTGQALYISWWWSYYRHATSLEMKNYWERIARIACNGYQRLDETHFHKQINIANTRYSLFNDFLMGFAKGVIIVAIIKSILNMLMPRTAYQDISPQYDANPKAKKERREIRTAKKSNFLQKRIRKSEQGGYNYLYDNTAANMDIMEVYLLPPDSSDTPDLTTLSPNATSWILFPFGRVAIVPLHTILKHGTDYKIFLRLKKHINYTVKFEYDMILDEIRGDVGLIEFPGLSAKRDIYNYFVDEWPSFGQVDQLLPSPTSTGLQATTAIGYENEIDPITVKDDYVFETDWRFYDLDNFPGMCGIPYCHHSTGKILAIHMGGSPSRRTCYATSIKKSDLESFHNKYRLTILKDALPVHMTEAQCLNGVQTLGVVPREWGVWMPTETALTTSVLDYKTFPFPETDDGPAHLKEENGISPKKVALAKYGKQYYPGKYEPSPGDSSSFYPKTFRPANIRMLTIEEAVYGIPGYLDSIDFSTSVGYFYKKARLTRRDLCFDENGEKRIHPTLRARVERKIRRLRKGKIDPIVYEENLKDEVRSAKKNAEFDTRLYSLGDFDSFVAQRMIFGTFIAEVTKDPVGSPVGLNMNVHSLEWGRLYSRLRYTGDRERKVLAGDFKFYDISHKNIFREEFAEEVCRFHPDPDLVRNSLESDLQSWHIIGMLVFRRPWGTSSGGLLTSLFNSYVNWSLHKKAFVALYGEESWKDVECTFTGDDSVVSLPVSYVDYNMGYLAQFFKEKYGMVYTTPFKDLTTEVTWENVTYLKRRFVPGHAGIMAPLDPKSLANMVKWTTKGSGMDVVESVLNSVLLEGWHYGEKVYQDLYDWIRSESVRLNRFFAVPSWEAMKALRKENYTP